MNKKTQATIITIAAIAILSTLITGTLQQTPTPNNTTAQPTTNPITTKTNLTYNNTNYSIIYPTTQTNLTLIIYTDGQTGGYGDNQTMNFIKKLINQNYAVITINNTHNDSWLLFQKEAGNNINNLLPLIFNTTQLQNATGTQITPTKIACVGYSGGAMGILAYINDPRIKAIATIAPAYTGKIAAITCPVLIICGANDTHAPMKENGMKYYNALNCEKYIVEVDIVDGHSIDNGADYAIDWLSFILKK